MSGTTKTLLIIGGFIALMVGTFIWFVATWDASKEQPVSTLTHTEAAA